MKVIRVPPMPKPRYGPGQWEIHVDPQWEVVQEFAPRRPCRFYRGTNSGGTCGADPTVVKLYPGYPKRRQGHSPRYYCDEHAYHYNRCRMGGSVFTWRWVV